MQSPQSDSHGDDFRLSRCRTCTPLEDIYVLDYYFTTGQGHEHAEGPEHGTP